MKITSADQFKQFAESKDDFEFSKIYGDSTNEIWIEILLKYPEHSRLVAANRTISMEILNLLSINENWITRCDVATKRRINREIFERLALDSHPGVRQAIVHNPKIPIDILKALINDTDELVAEAARKKLGLNDSNH